MAGMPPPSYNQAGQMPPVGFGGPAYPPGAGGYGPPGGYPPSSGYPPQGGGMYPPPQGAGYQQGPGGGRKSLFLSLWLAGV